MSVTRTVFADVVIRRKLNVAINIVSSTTLSISHNSTFKCILCMTIVLHSLRVHYNYVVVVHSLRVHYNYVGVHSLGVGRDTTRLKARIRDENYSREA